MRAVLFSWSEFYHPNFLVDHLLFFRMPLMIKKTLLVSLHRLIKLIIYKPWEYFAIMNALSHMKFVKWNVALLSSTEGFYFSIISVKA